MHIYKLNSLINGIIYNQIVGTILLDRVRHGFKTIKPIQGQICHVSN